MKAAKRGFHVQTVCPISGKIFWSKATHPTRDEAIGYAQKRVKSGRRILIWQEHDGEIHLKAYMRDKHSYARFVPPLHRRPL
mgnify:FL=1